MEHNTSGFRLRLNLFDGIVIVLALAVGAFLAWTALKPAAPVPADPRRALSVTASPYHLPQGGRQESFRKRSLSSPFGGAVSRKSD